MSYKCGICEEVSPHGQDRLLHVVYRDVVSKTFSPDDGLELRKRREIEREIPVCKTCHMMLEAGIPMVRVDSLPARG
jgi:hypothetical protein